MHRRALLLTLPPPPPRWRLHACYGSPRRRPSLGEPMPATAFAGAGFTWQSRSPSSPSKPDTEELPGHLIYFKGGLSVDQAHASMNTDAAWTSYIKLTNRSQTLASSAAGSLHHGPEGCLIAGHLNVRKVPGTLRLLLHTGTQDHEHTMINSSHLVVRAAPSPAPRTVEHGPARHSTTAGSASLGAAIHGLSLAPTRSARWHVRVVCVTRAPPAWLCVPLTTSLTPPPPCLPQLMRSTSCGLGSRYRDCSISASRQPTAPSSPLQHRTAWTAFPS